MDRIALLHRRLDELAAALRATEKGLGLLGLGSVGLEIARLDAWSDLDFFVFVKPGTKAEFLTDTTWFSKAHEVKWLFRNTSDGFKLLFADGVFGEMAFFEPHEALAVPYAPGRWIWRDPSLPESLSTPSDRGKPAWLPESTEWALGELLSCLYVGLGRFRRGEKLSAWRFVQGHCFDRFLEIVDREFPSSRPGADFYSRERRWESLHPDLAPVLERLLPGYAATPDAALAMLAWLEQHFDVNAALAAEIRTLGGA